MRVVIRPHAVTLGDLEDFEATTGCDLVNAVALLHEQREDELSPAEHVSLVWIFSRQIDPTFTRDRARALLPSDVEYHSAPAAEE